MTHPGSGPLSGRTILFAQPSSELYGSDRVLLESVEAVLHAGARAVVALPQHGPLEAALTAAGATVEICATPVLTKSGMSARGMLALLSTGARGFRAGRRLLSRVRPDAVYVNTVTIPLWIGLARLAGTPVLAHIHEAEGSAARPIALALNFPLSFATRLIANSEYSVSVLARSFPRLARRTSVVYNGVPGPGSPRSAREALDGGLRILFVGRLSRRKGALVAVEALGALRDRGVAASLDIVGAPVPGAHDYENELVARIHELGLADHVQLRGFRSDIWPSLETADVAVVPSLLDEPFGNTAVEALLAARPVVVSDTSGLREAAGEYLSSRSVIPGDPEALADALAAICREWESVRVDASLDRLRAEQKHSPAKYRGTIALLVSEIAAAPSAIRSRPTALPDAQLTTNKV
ncbi:glycosyl transferase family 1 [Subtercola boreus]|uniref:Glycosyl transferase family 1 n=1 Tax=Subtercola boreus TaxID=120213 RepID=A0A3E0VY44_9MICO|nr:glycosyltransferase [Subtercola boreus]RFA14651.1 glycosyl transferase family 1 [Subtercola boreus]